MFQKTVIAIITSLLFLTNVNAQRTVSVQSEPVPIQSEPTQSEPQIVEILDAARKINATDKQTATAIKEKLTPEEFVTRVLGRIKLIAPTEAPKGSPVQILVEGMPEKVAELWRRQPIFPTDVWLELYDRNGNPVNIFWSNDSGPRIFELIIAENGPEIPVIDIATHELKYGPSQPGPLPFPEPPTPSDELQRAVRQLVQFSEEVEVQDLLNLSEFYYDFADVVRRDINIIKTTEVFRNTYMRAGQLMFQQTGMQGKYEGLSELVDKILSDNLGLEIVPLPRAQAADILNAVAWAFYQGLK